MAWVVFGMGGAMILSKVMMSMTEGRTNWRAVGATYVQ